MSDLPDYYREQEEKEEIQESIDCLKYHGYIVLTPEFSKALTKTLKEAGIID